MATVRRRAPLALLLLLVLALVGGALFMVAAPGDDGRTLDADGVPSNEPTAAERPSARRSPPRPRERVAEHAAQPLEPTSGRDAPDRNAPRVPVATPRPQRRTVNVTVQREGGVPVRGARVAAAAGFGDPLDVGDARTDVEGRVTLSLPGAGTFVVRAWTDDAAAVGDRVSAAPGASLDVTLTLEPGRPVLGRVLTETSAPLAGAAFTLLVRVSDPFGRSIRGTSDDEGRVDLGGLPARLLDDPWTSAYAEAAGYARRTVPVSEALEGGEIVLRLARGQVVRGRCVAAGAAPVGGVRVNAADSSAMVTTRDGRFEIEGVSWEGGALTLIPPQHAAPAPIVLPAGAGEIDVGDVILASGQPISGVVVDDQERPVAGATLSVVRQGVRATVRTGRSDALGRFTLPHIGDGLHTVVAERAADGDWSTSVSASVADVTAGTTGLRIVISEGLTLLVTFKLESDGSPVRVATVEVEYERTDGGAGATMSGWSGPVMASVRIPLQDAGSYRVTISIPGYEPATLEDVTIREDRATRLDALFRRAPE